MPSASHAFKRVTSDIMSLCLAYYIVYRTTYYDFVLNCSPCLHNTVPRLTFYSINLVPRLFHITVCVYTRKYLFNHCYINVYPFILSYRIKGVSQNGNE